MGWNRGCGLSGLRDSPDVHRIRGDDAWVVTSRLEIEMPDRTSAFQLEDELRRFYPLAVGSHGHWHVEVDGDADDLAEAVTEAEEWLREHEVVPVLVRLTE